MLYHLLIAGVGIVALMAVWLGVQWLGRRQSGDDCDGPEAMTCGACASERANQCNMRLNEPDTE
jgi:hypothetical protein